MNLQIARIGPEDAMRRTDRLRDLELSVSRGAQMYPGIALWITQQVLPGIRRGTRTAYVGYLDGRAVATAVAKIGPDAKFCHLRIDPAIRGQHLGELFFSLMTLDVRGANSIHFTLPESLWQEQKEFFISFGFLNAEKADTQYRLFDEELFCRAPFALVWNSVLEKLPRLEGIPAIGGCQFRPDVVLSLKPDYARLILTGKKTVEIRRRFDHAWAGKHAVLYASRPTGALLGEVLIERIVSGDPGEIWEEYRPRIGCDRSEYDSYVTGARRVSALILSEARPYVSPIPLSQVSHLSATETRAPQSHCAVAGNDAWRKATAIAAMLHGVSRMAHTTGAVESPPMIA